MDKVGFPDRFIISCFFYFLPDFITLLAKHFCLYYRFSLKILMIRGITVKGILQGPSRYHLNMSYAKYIFESKIQYLKKPIPSFYVFCIECSCTMFLCCRVVFYYLITRLRNHRLNRMLCKT